MSYIVDIKSAIIKLDSGPFQNLCDEYLNECGYKNIIGLGSKPGTTKTTPGTPDTYYCIDENNKYIFVEYTTQQDSIYKKILSDINKCLDEEYTGITCDRISEILYFHTTSNITPQQDIELKKLCESQGILLKLYGIDYFANDLFDNHKYLIKQHLGISIATEQILTKSDFISIYNKAKTSAPIDTDFKYRSEEIESILKKLDTNNVVMLCGAAGVGKTRLAIECCERYAEKSSYTFLCIRNNNQPIYDDLYLFFRKHQNYIVLIDDANELSHLENIFRYLNEQNDVKYKIILTVRNYAAEDVLALLRSCEDIGVQRISPLHDDEIKELLKEELNINNDLFLDRIVTIAEGNARIAFLAGKISVDTNSLNSIQNVTDIYATYYGKYFYDIDLKERNLFIAAAIAAFIGAVRIDYLDEIASVISVGNMDVTEFKNHLYDLYQFEVIDIFKDTAVRFEDQCLANYLLYYVFIEKKWIKLSETIKSAFLINKNATISAINVLFNLFVTEENHEYLYSEIKLLWKELSNGDPLLFWEYVKVFHQINPTESLLLIKNKIDETEPIIVDVDDLKNDDNNNSISDEIIEILSKFDNNDNLELALDLYFMYFQKRPDLINQFYCAAKNHYGINKDCYDYNFYTPKLFIKKMIQYSDNWQNKFVNRLFVNVSSNYLKLHFNGICNVRNDKINCYSFDLINIPEVKEYREILWNSLIEMYSGNIETKKIEEILCNYGLSYNEDVNDVVSDDYKFILKLLLLFDKKDSYYFCKIISNLNRQFKKSGITMTAKFNELFNTASAIVYTKFNRHILESWDLEKSLEIQKSNIKNYLSDLNKENFFSIIDFFCDTDVEIEYSHQKAFNYAFEYVYECKPYYTDAINYYFQKMCNHSILEPYTQIQLMFKRYSDMEIWKKISMLPDDCRNAWQYNYFQLLPDKYIDFEHLRAWYDYLEDDSDKNLSSSGYRDLFFLKKFLHIDQNVIITTCQIILKKQGYSKFIVNIYFYLFFYQIPERDDETISAFVGNFEILSQIYIFLLSCDSQFDYDGSCLKEIYEHYPSILDLLFDLYYYKKDYLTDNDTIRLGKLFEFNDYENVIDYIIEKLFKAQKEFYFWEGKSIFGMLINKNLSSQYTNRPDNWIKHFISKYYNDKNQMPRIFNGISYLRYDQRTEYFKTFLSNNKSFEAFEKLPLFPSLMSWSGSEVPLIQEKIDFLNSLLPLLSGLDYLEHKNYIAKQIEDLKKRMKEVEINEIIRGY